MTVKRLVVRPPGPCVAAHYPLGTPSAGKANACPACPILQAQVLQFLTGKTLAREEQKANLEMAGAREQLGDEFVEPKKHPFTAYPPGWLDGRALKAIGEWWYPEESGNVNYKLMADLLKSGIN